MRKVIIYTIIILVIIILIVLLINLFVRISAKKQILKKEQYSKLENVDCILVLGAGIWNNSPSPMLEDRLLKAIELYNEGVSSKIIMSGDHGKTDYDEVNVMKNYAIEKGIPQENIFMDHAGFSSYESIYRASKIFEAKKIVIVTQNYN